MAVYTLGIWTVRPGHEEDFVRAWTDMADRTASDFPGSSATLLRDRDRPNRFISYGPWESTDQIDRWRRSDTFVDGVGRIRPLLDEFAPATMDVVTTVG